MDGDRPMKFALTHEEVWPLIAISDDAEMVANEDEEETIIDVPDYKIAEIREAYQQFDLIQKYLHALETKAGSSSYPPCELSGDLL